MRTLVIKEIMELFCSGLDETYPVELPRETRDHMYSGAKPTVGMTHDFYVRIVKLSDKNLLRVLDNLHCQEYR